MTLHDALILACVVAVAVALLWVIILWRTHRQAPFEGKRRVELIEVAFIISGLLAFAVSFAASSN